MPTKEIPTSLENILILSTVSLNPFPSLGYRLHDIACSDMSPLLHRLYLSHCICTHLRGRDHILLSHISGDLTYNSCFGRFMNEPVNMVACVPYSGAVNGI